MVRDVTSNRHGGNPESVAAYEDSRGHHQCDRALILSLIHERGDLTCDEFCVAVASLNPLRNPTPNDVSGRFTELHEDGLIVRTGETRLTRKGSKAAAWRRRREGDPPFSKKKPKEAPAPKRQSKRKPAPKGLLF